MSGWRILVREAAQALGPIDARGFHKDAIAMARRLSLIEPAGRSGPGRAVPMLYRATEAGRLYAQGRLAAVPKLRQDQGPGRPQFVLAATWLRALPSITPSQWGRLS